MLKMYEIGGVTYPVLFDNFSIFDYEQATGRPFSPDFSKVAAAIATGQYAAIPMVIMSDIIRTGMLAGARETGKAFSLTARDVYGVVSQKPELIGEMFVQCAEAMPKPTDIPDEEDQNTEGEPKKRTTTATTTGELTGG